MIGPDTLHAAGAPMPGADVPALRAECLTVWQATGAPRLRTRERAFLGRVRKRAERG
ncbi:hypothetical protein N9H60_02875 [Flavimaricola sp.]|nr:hypothetical protein [Flavimaricola sp.]